jgi:hypothetical protein
MAKEKRSMNNKEVLGLMLLLTLLVTPESSAKESACQVLSANGGKVILQCPERKNFQSADWVRLRGVKKKLEEGC